MARTGSDDCASAYEPDGASVISFAQERIWFVEQLIPGTPAYVVPVVYRVPVALDAQVFERACREIIRRHEVLRTGFDEDHDGRPSQRVAPTVDFTVRLFDLSDRSPLEREAEALRLATDEIHGPFDLRRPPLFRAMIVQVGEAGTIVVLTLHHIVADAWAVGVLTQELSEAYEAFADERPPKLPEVALQYSEFGRWQRDRLTDERLGDQLEYWRKTLEDAPGILDLPLDRTRPRKQTLCGAKEEIRLDAVLTASIESFARSCRATPFMVILSAFAALLHRYTDQTDIVVGTAVANRMSVDAERLIGFFANTLALRLNLSARPTFTDLVARTRETTLSAYANQDLPFERLVEELQPERDTSRTPLFQVWLVLQNAPLPPLRLGGTEGTPVELDNGTSKFDLSISLGVVGEELVGWVEYATDLFDRPTIARLVDHFEVFLAAAIEFPGRPIGALPLITRGEREALARDAAASRRDYPAKTVHELVADQVDRSPEAVAVVDEVTQMTYRELHERALTVAAMLASEGVVADEPVGLYLERSADAVAGLYGILLAGAAYLPLDPTYPRDRVAHMLNDSGARVVVTSTQARVPAGTSAKAVYVDGPRAAELEFTPRAVSPDSLGYVIYTSGSTGRPKGISLSHRSLTNLARWYGESLEPGAKTLQFSSLSFDASFHEIFFTLMSGGCVEICPEAAKRDPAVLLEVLRGRRIEKAILPAAAIEQVAEACEHDSRTVPLRELVSNAEQIQVTEAVRRLPQSMPRCAFYNQIGRAHV